MSESSIRFGAIKIFYVKKVIREKSTKFTKILNYIKYSCIIFCAKFLDIPTIYIVYKENFGLRVLKQFDLKVSKHFGPTIPYKKNRINAQKILNCIKTSYAPK